MLLAGQAMANDTFSIRGTLKGNAEGARVQMQYIDGMEPVSLGNTVVKDGKFELQGKVDSPVLASLTIDMNDPKDAQPDYVNKAVQVNFYVENSEITIEGDVNTLPAVYYNENRTGKAVIKGSKAQDDYDRFNTLLAPVKAKSDSLFDRIVQEYNIPMSNGQDARAAGIRLVNEQKPYKEQEKMLTLGYILANISSPVAFDEAYYTLSGYLFPLTAAEFDNLNGVLKAHWGETERYKKALPTIQKNRALAVGEKYVDIDLVDEKGKTVKLSSLIPQGKYCMLDFWASWCGPCRAEIPHLKKLAEAYKDFDIISVSLDEKDAAWKKALKEEAMAWPQLRNPKGVYGVTLDVYNITGIPNCIILDDQGRFVRSNMRGAYLDAFLAETFGLK